MLAGGVDGAVTPELIPDAAAYSLFLSTAAEPLGATAEQTRRQRAKLGRAQLSEPDLLAMAPILATFQQQQQVLEQSFRAGASPVADVDSLRAQLVANTRAALKSAITPDGLARLDALIQMEKRRMAIYPYPALP